MDSGVRESMDHTFSVNKICDTGVFECNVCFDLAQDPVVTLCGHLFCWPCLYRWLNFHSYSHECPVCKSLVKEDKLVPIYGRGTSNSDLRDEIPSRPVGQRPETAPVPDITYFRQDEFGTPGGFMPMATARLGDFTRTALFGAIPSLFNFHTHRFLDVTYGTTNGGSYFSTPLHDGYAHGFHQYPIHREGATSVLMKICFLFLGLLVILLLISTLPF